MGYFLFTDPYLGTWKFVLCIHKMAASRFEFSCDHTEEHKICFNVLPTAWVSSSVHSLSNFAYSRVGLNSYDKRQSLRNKVNPHHLRTSLKISTVTAQSESALSWPWAASASAKGEYIEPPNTSSKHSPHTSYLVSSHNRRKQVIKPMWPLFATLFCSWNYQVELPLSLFPPTLILVLIFLSFLHCNNSIELIRSLKIVK